MKTILREFLPLLLVIPFVMLFFRVIPDRRIAATCAGFLFVGVPLALMIFRWKEGGPGLSAGPRTLWWVGTLQFWLFFAVPILGSRLLFWETTFEDFTFFGRSGADWHRYSSKSYLLMVFLILGSHLWARAQAVQKQKAG
ncbi:MAG TPA: hypothetical protein PL182_06115 [Pseudobdellovibrionaceae bacterium]|nr:hypothetical protein [Pseudobdellovibrionaceae bacterium]